MSQWGVVDFVSRVAERVSTAGGGLAAQIGDHGERRADDVEAIALAHFEAAFPFVEPSPEFVEDLYRRLMEAPLAVESGQPLVVVSPDRRLVYGVAAIGSIASAAVVATIYFRARAASRAA